MSVTAWGRTLPARVRALVRDPVRWTEWLQLVKTVVAAVIAWLLAAHVFGLPQAFLAPWAALLVVHANQVWSYPALGAAAARLGVPRVCHLRDETSRATLEWWCRPAAQGGRGVPTESQGWRGRTCPGRAAGRQ